MKTISIAMLALLLVASAAQANIVWQDNFDSYAYALNWDGGVNWTIASGSVDLIGAGTPYDLLPGHGKYVDLDGTTGQGGTMQQSTSMNLAAGRYLLSFDLAGNRRVNTSDVVQVDVLVGLASQSYTLNKLDPFQTRTLEFVSTGAPVTLSFANSGGDNQGALLDNVVVQAIPAPAAALLALIGLPIVGWVKRRID